MVRRYSYGNKALMGDAEMYEEKDGEYVLYSDYARLEAALRECVEGFDSTTGFTDEEGDPLSRAMRKAREVLGDDKKEA